MEPLRVLRGGGVVMPVVGRGSESGWRQVVSVRLGEGVGVKTLGFAIAAVPQWLRRCRIQISGVMRWPGEAVGAKTLSAVAVPNWLRRGHVQVSVVTRCAWAGARAESPRLRSVVAMTRGSGPGRPSTRGAFTIRRAHRDAESRRPPNPPLQLTASWGYAPGARS